MPAAAQLIVSPTSGGGRGPAQIPRLAEAVRSLGFEVSAMVTESLDHARYLASDAAAAGNLVVAVGGDGLVSRVAADVARNGGLMAVVPMGTGNDFARCLGIRSLDDATRALRGEELLVDLGAVGSESFTCIASVGFDSLVVRRANAQRWPRGRFTYPYATLAELRTWRSAAFEVTLDGKQFEMAGYSVAVANGGYYGGGMRLAPDARLDDALFDVVAIADVSRVDFLRTAPRVFTGTHVKHPGVHVWRASTVSISCDRNFEVVADGEVAGTLSAQSPARMTVLPRALRIMSAHA